MTRGSKLSIIINDMTGVSHPQFKSGLNNVRLKP